MTTATSTRQKTTSSARKPAAGKVAVHKARARKAIAPKAAPKSSAASRTAAKKNHGKSALRRKLAALKARVAKLLLEIKARLAMPRALTKKVTA